MYPSSDIGKKRFFNFLMKICVSNDGNLIKELELDHEKMIQNIGESKVR